MNTVTNKTRFFLILTGILVICFSIIVFVLTRSSGQARDFRTPTSTPVSASQLALRQYLREMEVQLFTLVFTVPKINKLRQNPQLENQDWVDEMTKNIAKVRKAHQTLSQLAPPPEAESLHLDLIDATADCAASANFMLGGINNKNIEEFSRADALMKSFEQKMEAYYERIDRAIKALPTRVSTPIFCLTPTIEASDIHHLDVNDDNKGCK